MKVMGDSDYCHLECSTMYFDRRVLMFWTLVHVYWTIHCGIPEDSTLHHHYSRYLKYHVSLSMTSHCNTWTINGGSTNYQPQLDLYQFYFLLFIYNCWLRFCLYIYIYIYIAKFYFLFNAHLLCFCFCKFFGQRGMRDFNCGILRNNIPLDIFLIKVNIGIAVKDFSSSIFVLIDVWGLTGR